jgi:hypothetical protein
MKECEEECELEPGWAGSQLNHCTLDKELQLDRKLCGVLNFCHHHPKGGPGPSLRRSYVGSHRIISKHST